MIGPERLLDQAMPRHSNPDFTRTSRNEEDGDRLVRTNQLNRGDSAVLPQFDLGGNQVGAFACGSRNRRRGRNGNFE
jgi:hypothetical protein